MVDSRQKGARAEYQVRDILRAATTLQWERVPGSGGFGSQHGLKGDIYLPVSTGHICKYAIEVKHYKDDTINSNLFNLTVSQLEKFWEQTQREAGQMNAKGLLIFKKDRGKWLVAVDCSDKEGMAAADKCETTMVLTKRKTDTNFKVALFEEWLKYMNKEDLVK